MGKAHQKPNRPSMHLLDTGSSLHHMSGCQPLGKIDVCHSYRQHCLYNSSKIFQILYLAIYQFFVFSILLICDYTIQLQIYTFFFNTTLFFNTTNASQRTALEIRCKGTHFFSDLYLNSPQLS